MKNNLSQALLGCGMFFCSIGGASAQLYSFENKEIPAGWEISEGEMSVSDLRHKLGKYALEINWKKGSRISMVAPDALGEASKSGSGGLATWIYNEYPIDEVIIFSFLNAEGQEVCQLPFKMNFKGWRCIWSRFRVDMNMSGKARIHSMVMQMPDFEKGGTIYMDHLEFSKNVSWQKMSDLHYTVNHKDFSLIHNFIGYRNTFPDLTNINVKPDQKQAVSIIENRLTEWYLGDKASKNNPLMKLRIEADKAFVQKGLKEASAINIRYNADNTAAGEGLYPMYAPSEIDGEKVRTFRSINQNVLLPLALDYRTNEKQQSLDKALFIYDWFYDQGWADGSGMGTLCFEKLRSAGYFHSFFLLKDHLTPEKYERELATLKWLTMFGVCYEPHNYAGEVADNLRALALPKLIYALSLKDSKEREAAMSAYTNYMNNSLAFAPGFYGTIKADYSGYHHRGPYNSAYYPHALYAASLVAYLLHDTPYALSESSMNNLKQALLTFRFFSANLAVPSATTGRFPNQQQVLHQLLPAFAYVALSSDQPDTELIGALKLIYSNNQSEVKDYLKDVDANLTYTAGLGEVTCLLRALAAETPAEKTPQGSLFMPYSGLMVMKNGEHHFNMKGFSKYIWDYESSSNENLYGRYISYGQIEHFNLQNGKKSFHGAHKNFDWNYIPGTTSKVLPKEILSSKNSNPRHRSFSDESFLTGVAVSKQTALFSFKLHDISYDKTFGANKTVVAFDDILLCLGSDIRTADTQHPIVTTLLQTPDRVSAKYRSKKGSILSDESGLLYVVKGAEPQVRENSELTVAYIDHGSNPQQASYQYFIVPENAHKEAKKLLSDKNPIRVLMQNSSAHIVEHADNKVIYAAIFDAEKQFEEMLVQQVNIPLSYILESLDQQSLRLSFCEPDMRRATRKTMDNLTEEDVIQQEKPFMTEFVLTGNYTVKNANKEPQVRYENGVTRISIETVRGENYQLELIANQ